MESGDALGCEKTRFDVVLQLGLKRTVHQIVQGIGRKFVTHVGDEYSDNQGRNEVHRVKAH